MFYSSDLLGKKSPLGAIWIAAHGKKLNKGKIMQVNIGETCKQIMDPQVPHALRLQAILVGGVVIIYNKQQGFLLDDCTEMLRRMRAMSEPAAPGAALNTKKNKAKAEAITMPTEDMLGDFDLFPTFSTQLSGREANRGAPQASDDLFVIPTISEASSPRHAVERSPAGLLGGDGGGDIRLSLDGLERFELHMMDHPETFEVPDIHLDLPGMEMFNMPSPPAPGLGDDLFAVPEGDLPAGGADGGADALQPVNQERDTESSDQAGPSKAGAARKQQRKPRGKQRTGKKAPVVDLGDEVQIRGQTYRLWMHDRADLLVSRPQRRAAVCDSSPLILGPATAGLMGSGAWPAELAELWNRNASLGATASKPAKGKAAVAGGEELLEEQERELKEAEAAARQQGAPDYGAGMDFGYGDMYGEDMPLQDAGWLNEVAAAADNPFKKRGTGGGRRATSVATDDIETERLRAALNGTPGSALDALYMNPMGLTPASSDPQLLVTSNRNKRNRSSLRKDVEGALSEKSSDPSGLKSGRLPDLGELGEGDMAAMLPVVGEDELFLGDAEGVGLAVPASRKRQRLELGSGQEGGGSGTQGGTGTYGTISQFQLLEESGHGTQALGPSDCMNASTMALIGLLRAKFDALESQGSERNEVSLDDMAAKLTRSEAARLFAQILVTKSNDFTKLAQEEPYGDIIITRGPFL